MSRKEVGMLMRTMIRGSITFWTCILLAPALASATVYHVNADAIGADNGTDWPNAFRELRSALAVTQNGDEVWVSEGTYRPDYDVATRTHTGNRLMAFVLDTGIAVYGGFAGDESTRDERDPAAHPTRLSGDLAGNDGADFTNRADNSYHVASCTAFGTPATLDGFIITGGYADPATNWPQGGGLYHQAGVKSIVTHCTFTANYARDGGAIGGSTTDGYESTLSHCTFMGNKAERDGGGVWIASGALTLTDCVFVGNIAGYFGGGAYAVPDWLKSITVNLTRCRFESNLASSAGGGCFSGASLNLSDSEFQGNRGTSGSGGILCAGMQVSVTNCVFRQNSAGYGGGGGAAVAGGNPVFRRCLFVANQAAGGPVNSGGAGMAVFTASPTLLDCRFTGNVSQADGGGLIVTANVASTANMVNCVFNGNSATQGGALRSGSNATIKMSNCTLVGNTALGDGGAICAAGSLLLANCVVWANQGRYQALPMYSQIYNWSAQGTQSINYCCIQGWTPEAEGIGNVSSPPRFVDADGPDDVSGNEDDDFGLAAGSPCIDTGDNTALPPDVLVDLAGLARFVDDPASPDSGNGTPPIVDMGAFEAADPPSTVITRLYVDVSASGANDGSTWQDAYVDLQDAINKARLAGSIVEIWVAAGTYRPDRGTGDRTRQFDLLTGTALFGGFAGNETDLGQRDPAAHETILSGDLADDDVPGFSNNTENSIHVAFALAVDGTAVLDGFTITGGNADQPSTAFRQRFGGGIYLHAASPAIVHCMFRANRADYGGGAAFNDEGSRPVFTDCRFVENRVDGEGYVEGGGAFATRFDSSPTLTSCAFLDNSTVEEGGAVRNASWSSITLNECTFSGNSADVGGAFVDGNAACILTGCQFLGNSAVHGGAVELLADSSLTDCVFSGNSATYGGAIQTIRSDPTLSSCTMSGNRADYGAVYLLKSNPRILDCVVSGNHIRYGGAVECDQAQPLIIGGTICGSTGDNLPGSTAIRARESSNLSLLNCIVAGNVAYGASAIVFSEGGGLIGNCTIAANISTSNAGAVRCELGATPSLVNSMLWGGSGNALRVSSSTPSVAFCDIQGGWPGAGNINADPGFYPPITGAWSSPGAFDPDTHELVLTNAGAAWIEDDHVGKLINPNATQGRQFAIIANTATTITIMADATTISNGTSWVLAGASYQIHDYRLPSGSPGVDAGNNSLLPADAMDLDADGDVDEPLPVDRAWGPRVWDDPLTVDSGYPLGGAIVDMGAYERSAATQVFHVDAEATGANDGTSWASAFVHLQDALAAARAFDGLAEIWVARGTYTPDRGGGQALGDRAATFVLSDDMAIYGGFEGVTPPHEGMPDGETSRHERDPDPATNGTVLSGDLAGDDGPSFAGNADNSYHVVTTSQVITAIVNGVTIRGGNADDVNNDGRGGGLLNIGGRPVITTCIFTSNAAASTGGAVTNFSNALPVFMRCEFIDNKCSQYGGALANLSGAKPTVTGCRFVGNEAGISGGAMAHSAPRTGAGSVILLDCYFAGNIASGGNGGAIEGYWDRMTNCAFSGNAAASGGALAGVGVINNCTFAGNTATTAAGGILSTGTSSGLLMQNSILWGNRDAGGTDESAQIQGAAQTLNYCCVQGATGALGGVGNIALDPRFIDPAGPDGVVGTDDDDLRLHRRSPCSDAGDNTIDVDPAQTGAQPLPGTDLDGRPRFVDNPAAPDSGVGEPPMVDMGAYEYQIQAPADLDCDGDVDAVDLQQFIPCGSGPGVPQEDPDCRDADFDDDGDVDQFDFAIYQVCISGADVPADPACGR